MAYVFVRALPEMSEAQDVFTRVTFDRGLPFPELRVYTAALIGFLFFYGLERMAWRSGADDTERREEATPFAYRLRLCGFALYGGLVGYLMVHQRTLPTLLYLIAMALQWHCNFLLLTTRLSVNTLRITIAADDGCWQPPYWPEDSPGH